MAVYEGKWDCTTCGYKGVRGPESECTNCGADRPKNVKFYLADEASIVQNPEFLKKAKSGPDWLCSYCGENNKAINSNCKSCGNVRGNDDKGLSTKDYDTANVPRTGDGTKEKITHNPPSKSSSLKKTYKKGCLIAFGLFVLLFIFFIPSKEIAVTVDSFEWIRIIEVEENKKLIEEDWQMPGDGTLITTFRAIHHHDKVLDHYERRTRTQQREVGQEQYVCGKRDLGNGYFEDKYCTRSIYESYEEEYDEPIYRKEPVYQTKYRYSVYRWKASTPIRTSGKNQNPHWGNTTSIDDNSKLRESNRNGKYIIYVVDEDKEKHSHEILESQWMKLSKGVKLKAKKGSMTGRYRGLSDDAFK